MTGDDFNLQRFVEAQDRDRAYDRAVDELEHGRKQGHWIWFVFPQIQGLGSSSTAQFYAISSLDEATAYLKHPVLGPRLDRAAETLLKLPARDPAEILGGLDAMKLCSSMTLFSRVEDAAPAFARVLDEFYAGRSDEATERLLA